MNNIKISIFASAIRPWLWNDFFKSLESTTEEYEVVFAGPKNLEQAHKDHEFTEPKNFTYIQTANTKPAQCYEVALRACQGETISWSADDCESPNDVYGKAYRYWKSLKQDKAALSIQTVEDEIKYNMHDHSYVGFNRNTPLMAPVVLMSRQFMNDLGGFDRRFVCGQYENDATMRIYEAGGCVLIFKDGEVYIDHAKKHKEAHSFRAGYSKDRQVLESIWGKRGELLYTGKSLKHEPFSKKDILVKSQSNNMPSIWK